MRANVADLNNLAVHYHKRQVTNKFEKTFFLLFFCCHKFVDMSEHQTQGIESCFGFTF